MKLSSYPSTKSQTSFLLAIGLIHQLAATTSTLLVESFTFDPSTLSSLSSSSGLQGRLIDKCCQIGKERAIESANFNCKLGAREALLASTASSSSFRGSGNNLLASYTESLLANNPNFSDQCEMVLESCCLAHHRTRNCDSGKQFAKSGSACMDVELSKEATIATESFNDCCMSCSLGILAAKTQTQNETAFGYSTPSRLAGHSNLSDRCKLISPLAASLSGQLYEQTYIECCQENLPRFSSALLEPGAPIDCSQANPCSQRCVATGNFEMRHRCDCFAGYKLASDGITCVDIDECKLNQHSCNRQSEVCDNTRGSFRCLARQNHNTGGVFAGTNNQQQANSPMRSQSLTEDGGETGGSSEFASMRLCPLGSRWNNEEKRCQVNEIANHASFHRRNSSSLSSFSRSFSSGHTHFSNNNNE